MHYVEIISNEKSTVSFCFVDLAVSDKKKRQMDDDQKSKESAFSRKHMESSVTKQQRLLSY